MGGRHECFAQATPGLERLVAAELADLGVRAGRVEPGGVAFRATTRQLYAANLWLRTANRVLVRSAQFAARTFAELERRLAKLPWDAWLPSDARPVFRVSSSRSALYHTGAVLERCQRVVPGAAGPGEPEQPEQLVVVRLVHDRLVLSLDSSGEPLHRRGWRRAGAKAPLRETLAAAAVAASGWDGATPLADPLCGSGTIAVEAALRARDLAPGLGRAFAFQSWAVFEPGTWASVLGEAQGRARPPGRGPSIVAADRDAGAVAATRANAERAGVADDMDILCRPLSDLPLPPPADDAGTPTPGWLVTNPPYGARLGGGRADLRNLYAALGHLAGRGAGWRVALLVADPALAGHTGLRLEERLRSTNGGIPVRLLVSDGDPVPSASGPAPPARRRGARRAAGPAREAGPHRPPAGRTG